MALQKPRELPPADQEISGTPDRRLIDTTALLRQLREDIWNDYLRSHREDDWDEFVELLDAERLEGQKLFPKI